MFLSPDSLATSSGSVRLELRGRRSCWKSNPFTEYDLPLQYIKTDPNPSEKDTYRPYDGGVARGPSEISRFLRESSESREFRGERVGEVV